jgi:hypothetical protein
MHEARSGSWTISGGWRRLLDGDRPWGSVEIQPDRFGLTRYRLTVYPPGISESDRRRIRLARWWPMWAAPVWIICQIVAGELTGPWEALAISTACYLGLGLAAVVMAGDQRRQVRTIGAAVLVGYDDPESAETVHKLKVLAARLIEADTRVQDGRLSPTEHELIWWGVYDSMATDRPADTNV